MSTSTMGCTASLRVGVLVARKNVGLRPRLLQTDGDRWVSSTNRTKPVYPTFNFVSGARSPRTGQPQRRASVVVELGQSLVPRLFDVDRADAVVELGQAAMDLGIGLVRVPRDGPGETIFLVEPCHELGDGRVAQRRVVLEHVAELTRELADGRGRIVVRHRRSPSAPWGRVYRAARRCTTPACGRDA